MTLVERAIAGPGSPNTALGVLSRAGWDTIHDENGNTYAFPADHRAVVAFLPEDNDFAEHGKLWVVRAYSDLHAVVWEATFTVDTPAELIAACLADLVKNEPLDRYRDDDI
jgi:hypothetical protein